MIGFLLLWTTIISEVFAIKNKRTRSMEYVHKKVSSTSLKNKSLSRNYTFETLHFTAQPSIKHGFESKRETFANKFQASFFLSEFSITARCRSYSIIGIFKSQTRRKKFHFWVVSYIRFGSGFNHAGPENWILTFLKFSKVVRFR